MRSEEGARPRVPRRLAVSGGGFRPAYVVWELCPNCQAVLPPDEGACPHCRAGRPAAAPAVGALGKAVLGSVAAIAGGGVVMVTLAACYGVPAGYQYDDPDLRPAGDLLPSDAAPDGGGDGGRG